MDGIGRTDSYELVVPIRELSAEGCWLQAQVAATGGAGGCRLLVENVEQAPLTATLRLANC
jgi:hypothetical protein